MRFVTYIGVLGVLMPAAGQAQDPPLQKNWAVSIGGGVVTLPSHPGSDELRTLPIPLISVEYKGRFFLGGAPGSVGGGIGAYIVRSSSFAWTMSLAGSEYRRESFSDALAGMGNRPVSVGAASGVSFRRGIFNISLGAQLGFNNDAGVAAHASAGVGGAIAGRWFGSLGTAVAAGDGTNMGYDFGISDEQAARRRELIEGGDPRLRPGDGEAFDPSAGIKSIGLNGSLGYIISLRWTAIGFLSVNRLEGDAWRSPLTRQRTTLITGLGLSYRI